MHTMDCKGPDCVECKQTSKGKSSEEKNQCKAPETVGRSSEEKKESDFSTPMEREVAWHLVHSIMIKDNCMAKIHKLKQEVHRKTSELTNILRERELELCMQIDMELLKQMGKIDSDVTLDCLDKLANRYDINKRPLANTTLCLSSDFDKLKKTLKCFGQLKYENDEELIYKLSRDLCSPWIKEDFAEHSALPTSTNSLEKDAKVGVTTVNEEIYTDKYLMDMKSKLKRGMKEVEENIKKFSVEELGHQRVLDSACTGGDDLKESPRGCRLFDPTGSIRSRMEALRQLRGIEHPRDSNAMAAGARDYYIKKYQPSTVNDEPETLAGQIKRRFANLDHRMQLDLARQRRKNTDSLTDKEVQDYSFSFKRPFITKENHGRIMRECIGNQCCEFVDSVPIKRVVSDSDWKKRIELLNRQMEDMVCTNSMPNLGVGEDSSSLQETYGYPPQEEPTGEGLEELRRAFRVEVKKDEIARQSSESSDSLPSEDTEKDSLLDEDDIEIISRNEAASIPSDASISPPLPPKNRFRFAGKPSCLPFFRRKRSATTPFLSVSSASSESKFPEGSASSTAPSFDTEEDGSSIECHVASKDGGEGHDLSTALRSSFTKYLEKNPKSQWLAPDRSSEQPLPAGDSFKAIPIQNLYQATNEWVYRDGCVREMYPGWRSSDVIPPHPSSQK